MSNTKSTEHEVTRRDFIKASMATGVGTVGLVSTTLLAPEAMATTPGSAASYRRILGANDRLRYGFIGQGGMGYRHMTIIKDFGDQQQENVEVVAVCDVFEKRRKASQVKAGIAESQSFLDYQRILENREIDVVVIATPDHWHARQSIEALEAGKHIYLEKPMTRTLDEAFQLYDVAKRTGKSVQVGSHGCSDPKWLKSREIIKSGKLGRMLWAQGSYCRNNQKGEWNYKIEPEASPETIDWKRWLGPAKNRPFSTERFYRWRKYWDYANGIIGDLWPHRLHPLMMAMNLTDFPRRVSCHGGILCDTDQGYGEPREVADTTLMTVDFPGGAMIFLAGATVNERGIEDMIRGQKGNLLFGGGKVQVVPERPFVDELEASDETPPNAGENHQKHQKNFIDALRANIPPNCDIELAVRVQAVVSMAEESYRKGRMMQFDPRRRKMYA